MRLLLPLLLSAMILGPVRGQEPAPAGGTDAPARRFLDRCAGCHSIGGGNRTGPDLLPSSAWKPADLAAAVKRMEKNVGPLPDGDVINIVEFLKDTKARDRIAAEEARMALAAAAALEPASASIGRSLFMGLRPLANGGASCTACHALESAGGTLGPSLATVHQRMGGDVALASAIEKSSFNIMKPIYAAHPVTKQEAAHLTAFLATLGTSVTPPPEDPPIGYIGLAGSVIVLGALAALQGRRRAGTRAQLVAKSTRS